MNLPFDGLVAYSRRSWHLQLFWPPGNSALARSRSLRTAQSCCLPAYSAPGHGEYSVSMTLRHVTVTALCKGHWRQQACGPNHADRRPKWIAPYVKGPEGAPLKKDRVHVWRK